MENQIILIACIAVIGLAIVLQTIFLLAIFMSMRKAVRSLRKEIGELRSSVMPVVDNVRDLISRLSPKIEGAVDDLADTAHSLRKQSVEVQASVGEVMERLQEQLHRIDEMTTCALDGVNRASDYLIESVNKPVRQLSAIFAAVKAVIETLRGPVPRRSGNMERPQIIHPPPTTSSSS